MGKIGRNEPCPCGSGKKYKKCHYGQYDSDIMSADGSQLPVLFCKVNDDFEESGLAVVFVAREHQNGQSINLVVYLCDIFCLGVKNVSLFPSCGERTVEAMEEVYGLDFVTIDYKDARNLVLGAVQYAQGIGFEPHAEWSRAKIYLEPDNPYNVKRFIYGFEGKPLYVTGPDDDYQTIMDTLEDYCGVGNFDYIIDARANFIPNHDNTRISIGSSKRKMINN